jgi:thioredoxin-like negative regulator of GroEL
MNKLTDQNYKKVLLQPFIIMVVFRKNDQIGRNLIENLKSCNLASIKMYECDLEKETEMEKRFRIVKFPKLAIFKNGKTLGIKTGLLTKNEIKDFLLEVTG